MVGEIMLHEGRWVISVFVTAPMFCTGKFIECGLGLRRSRTEVEADTSCRPNAAPISEQEDITEKVRGH